MSVKIIQKSISPTLKRLLEGDKITEHQRDLWTKYIAFLNAEQIKDLNEVIKKDEESFWTLIQELESKTKIV